MCQCLKIYADTPNGSYLILPVNKSSLFIAKNPKDWPMTGF